MNEINKTIKELIMNIKIFTFIAANLCAGLSVYASEVNLNGTMLSITHHKRIIDDALAVREEDKPFSVNNICEKIKNHPRKDKIKKIDLSYNFIGDKSAGTIANLAKYLKNLRILDLSNNKITGEGLINLAPLFHNENFEYLIITGNPAANVVDFSKLISEVDDEETSVALKTIWLPKQSVSRTSSVTDKIKKIHTQYYESSLYA